MRSDSSDFGRMKSHVLDSPIPPRHRRDGVCLSYVTSDNCQFRGIECEVRLNFLLNGEMEKEVSILSQEFRLTTSYSAGNSQCGLMATQTPPRLPFTGTQPQYLASFVVRCSILIKSLRMEMGYSLLGLILL